MYKTCLNCGGVGHTDYYCPFKITELNKANQTNNLKDFYIFKNNDESQENKIDSENLICSRCGKSGHVSFKCSETVCTNCGEFGHLANECTNQTKSKTISLLENWIIDKHSTPKVIDCELFNFTYFLFSK
jgi:ribosomal protein L37E